MGMSMRGWVVAVIALTAGAAFGVEKPKATTTVPETTEAKPGAPAEGDKAAEKKVRYKKSKQVDFSNQTVEGKLHRPEASLVTASEGVTDNGLLRLREDFLDKFTTFAGEEIQQ